MFLAYFGGLQSLPRSQPAIVSAAVLVDIFSYDIEPANTMLATSSPVEEVKRLLPAQAQDDFQATIALTRSYLLAEVHVEETHRDLLFAYVSGLWAVSSYRQRQSTLSRNATLAIVAGANRSIAELKAVGADSSAMDIRRRLIDAGFLPGLA